MKRYSDFNDGVEDGDVSNVKWTKYKIVVPTEEDKKEIMDALEHMHYSDIDTENVTVNQLAHEYLNGTNIVVDPDLYESIL